MDGGPLEGRISYTLQDARDADTGRQLSNCPKHLPKVNMIFPLVRDQLFAGMELQYLSPRRAIDSSKIGDAFIANVTLVNRNWIKNVEISASLYNLFNQKHRDPGAEENLMVGIRGIVQDGITFRFKLKYSF
jgi:outer membrane receptor for ferrienterochelin and colicin